MELEISTEKYFNNSNRDKNILFNVKGNTENVFRVKRNRCELLENLENNYRMNNFNKLSLNNSSINTIQSSNPSNSLKNGNFFQNNSISKTNNNDKLYTNISSANYNFSIQKEIIFDNFISNNTFENKILTMEQNNCNQYEIIAKRIEFDTAEVDKNLNNILKNLSKKDMLNFENIHKKENKIFSNIIKHALEENCINNETYNNLFNDEKCNLGLFQNLEHNVKNNNLLYICDFPIQSNFFSNDITNKSEQNLSKYQDNSIINFQSKLRKLK